MKETLFLLLVAVTALSGTWLGQACPVDRMGLDEADTRATAVAHRIMECFGGDGFWSCRPAGISQTQHPEILVHPVVTCEDHACRLVAP